MQKYSLIHLQTYMESNQKLKHKRTLTYATAGGLRHAHIFRIDNFVYKHTYKFHTPPLLHGTTTRNKRKNTKHTKQQQQQ